MQLILTYVQASCDFFRLTVACLKENSEIKDKFFKKTHFLALDWGVHLYMGKYGIHLKTLTKKHVFWCVLQIVD